MRNDGDEDEETKKELSQLLGRNEDEDGRNDEEYKRRKLALSETAILKSSTSSLSFQGCWRARRWRDSRVDAW